MNLEYSPMERKVALTKDGSSTIHNSSLNQHYHSIHGAVQESKHVFMKMGWEEVRKSETTISVLEMGFGTGLNAFLILLECIADPSLTVQYTTLEAFPLEKEEIIGLNYAEQLKANQQQENFLKLHRVEWEIPVSVENGFTLLKRNIKLEDFIPDTAAYDLVFYDAFAPDAQPELWTEDIFKNLFDGMKPGGMLVTYCAKGQVRRNLIAAGFSVERLQGPVGKREMLRGRK